MIYKREKLSKWRRYRSGKLLEIVPYPDAFQNSQIPFSPFFERYSPSYFRNVLEVIKPIDIQTLGGEHFRDCESAQNREKGWFRLCNIYISARQ